MRVLHTVRSPPTRGQSGQSPVIGLVVLLGIVAVVSALVFVAALDTTEDARQDAEVERMTESFLDLRHEVATASAESAATRSADLSAAVDHGTVQTDAQGGTVSMTVGNETVVDDQPMGTIEYAAADGRVLAYEGGGVWRGTEADAVPVSGPPVSDRADGIDIPVTTLAVEDGTTPGSVSLQAHATDLAYRGVLYDSLTLTIESEYAGGWATHFSSTLDAANITQPAPNQVVVTVDPDETGGDEENGSPPGDGGDDGLFEQAMTSQTDVDVTGNTDVLGDIVANGSISVGGNADHHGVAQTDTPVDREPHDDAIETLLAGASDDDWQPICEDFPGDCTFDEPGTYFIDEQNARGSQDVIVDVADGDVRLVLDTELSLEGSTDLIVENADSGNGLELYTTEDVNLAANTDVCVDPCEPDSIDAQALQIFASSTADIDIRGNVYFEGVISAPTDGAADDGCNACLDSGGNLEYYGAIEAGLIEVSGNVHFEYDETLDGYEPPEDVPVGPPGDGPDDGTALPLTLQVAITEIGVEDV